MHSHGPSRVVRRLPPSSSTKTSRCPLSTKKHSSTSWVCAALPCPGGTNMIERVKFFAGMTVGSPCLPEPPAPIKRCCARLYPSILASSNAAQSGFFSRKRPTNFSMICSIGTPTSSGGRSCRATLMGKLLCGGMLRRLYSSRAARQLIPPPKGRVASEASRVGVGRLYSDISHQIQQHITSHYRRFGAPPPDRALTRAVTLPLRGRDTLTAFDPRG